MWRECTDVGYDGNAAYILGFPHLRERGTLGMANSENDPGILGFPQMQDVGCGVYNGYGRYAGGVPGFPLSRDGGITDMMEISPAYSVLHIYENDGRGV